VLSFRVAGQNELFMIMLLKLNVSAMENINVKEYIAQYSLDKARWKQKLLPSTYSHDNFLTKPCLIEYRSVYICIFFIFTPFV